MHMNVICYGDSNTYGYDPRSYFGDRYDSGSRWVDILARKTGWNIENQGMNGRGIPGMPVSFSKETDLLIVMLGTNDLLLGRSPEGTAQRMERFLGQTGLAPDKILLIAPPPMVMGTWVEDMGLIHASRSLAGAYGQLARELAVKFADAGTWDVSLAFDGVHFTEDGHRAFARSLYHTLNTLDKDLPVRPHD